MLDTSQQDVPETVRKAFTTPHDIAEALAYTRELATTHYENFSVISLLLPRHLRQDFCNVYAFCRTADDLGDEIKDDATSLNLLERFRQETRACYAGDARSIVFVALQQTIRRHDIPVEPFLDLIDAFEQDRRVNRYETFDQVLDYCRRSADPVGRLVLYMSGHRDARRQELSDRTCTALQLANFWQDVRRDYVERDRIYLPRESMQRFGVTEEQIRDGRCDENYRRLMEFEVDRTEKLFDEGQALLELLEPSIRGQVALFAAGGRAILKAIRKQNYDTLTSRPALSKLQKGKLIASAVSSKLFTSGGGESELDVSRTYCRDLARNEARNFYYGLMLLPEPKRSDMFALYAYMRLVDDIADNADGRTVAQRMTELDAWRERSHGAVPDDSPIWPAFTEMARRCRLPAHIIDDMIEGQRQDLNPQPFETFDDLQKYCYRVAGVVGLASIYIWGFEGGKATEELAIQRGLAFQLTNILRDIREDLGKGRVYLPRQELVAMELTPEELLNGGRKFEDLMRFQIARAEKYYELSSALEDRVAADARPTLAAMTDIYHGLLDRIGQDPGRVLRERVSLSFPAKIRIAWRAKWAAS